MRMRWLMTMVRQIMMVRSDHDPDSTTDHRRVVLISGTDKWKYYLWVVQLTKILNTWPFYSWDLLWVFHHLLTVHGWWLSSKLNAWLFHSWELPWVWEYLDMYGGACVYFTLLVTKNLPYCEPTDKLLCMHAVVPVRTMCIFHVVCV